jgi:hypothetical protein
MVTVLVTIGGAVLAAGLAALIAERQDVRDTKFLRRLSIVLSLTGIVVLGISLLISDWLPFNNEKDSSSTTGPPPPALLADLAASLFNPAGKQDQPSKEYVCILNDSRRGIEMRSWRLDNRVGRVFTFPAHVKLLPGDELRVYTGTGVDSPTDLYARKTREVWNDGGDSVSIYRKNSNGMYDEVFEDDYPPKDEGEYTGACEPSQKRETGLSVAEFGTGKTVLIPLKGTETRRIRDEPEFCDYALNCIRISYRGSVLSRPAFLLPLPDHLSLSSQKALCLQARGTRGGERFAVGISTSIQEPGPHVLFPPLSTRWQKAEASLEGIPKEKLRSVASLRFAVTGREFAGAALLQRVYAISKGSCEEAGPLVSAPG